MPQISDFLGNGRWNSTNTDSFSFTPGIVNQRLTAPLGTSYPVIVSTPNLGAPYETSWLAQLLEGLAQTSDGQFMLMSALMRGLGLLGDKNPETNKRQTPQTILF